MASRSANLFELLRDAGEGDAPKKRKEDPAKAAAPKAAAPAKPAAPKAAAKKAESPAVKPAQPKAAPSKAAAKPAAAPAKAAAGGAVSSADKKPRADRPAREGGNNRPRGEGRPPRENREVREGGEGAPRRERRDRDKADRSRSDVVKEDKGFVQISKRVHDRRPGTGRPSNENKKGGAGKANWGKPGSELEAAEPATEAVEQSEEATGEAKTEETKEEAPQPKVLTPEEEEALKEKEREERMLTLEEYKKKAEEEKANVPLPAPRQAGEGVNPDKWSSYQKLEKNENDSLFSVSQKGKGNKTAAPAAAAAANKKANVVPVTDVLGFKAGERKPERGPRESRGRRGDFAGKGPRTGGNKTEFSLSDQAFPALKETAKA